MLRKIKELIRKFLTTSQKFTGTDNIYIATHGSYLGIGNLINIIASFLLAMAFAKLLPREVYGDYRYIISIVTIIGIFALPGMDDAVLQATANKFEGSLKKGFKEKLRWSMLGSLSCLVVGGYFFFFKENPALTISFLIAGAFFPIMQSTGLYLSYLGGKKLFKAQVKYNVLTQIISSLAIIVTLFLTNNIIILVLVYFSSYTTLSTIFILLSVKKFPANKNENEEFIKFGKHLSFLRILSTIASQIDKILLFNFIGPINLAIYSFAILPASEADLFLKNIRALALPKLANREKEEIKKTLIKKVAKATILIAPLVLIYILVAPYLFRIFFPEYMDSVFYSQLFFLTILAFPGTFVALAFQAKMAKKELYWFSITTSLILITLLIILTPVYGILGVIFARLINQFIAIAIAVYFFKKM
jgi:O-antigen/teichoic acid export membrane protein